MEIQIDIFTVIALLGAAQAVVVGTALLTVKDLKTRVFGLMLLNLGAVMGTILYAHTHPEQEPLASVLIEVAITLVAPVLLFAFAVLVVQPELRHWVLLAAVVPAVWFLQALLVGVLRRPADIWIPPIEALVGHQVAYTLISAVLVFSASAKQPLVSVAFLRLARLTVLFMALIHVAQGIRLLDDSNRFRNVVPFTSGFAVIALTFVAARQSRVFLKATAAKMENGTGTDDDVGQQTAKYESSSLSNEESEKGHARFRHAMEVDQSYRRPNLTLDQLAEELGLARTYLSQVVNERCGKPFLEVVADYRVEEARRLLADDAARHLTAEAIGSRAGFQSKSAFYAAFRKRMGLAPAAYRRRIQRPESKTQDSPHQE